MIMSGCDLPNLTQCDRCILNLLRSHLMQANGNDLECSQIQQLLTQFREALDQGGVISLEIDGQAQFMTQRAERLLSKYFSPCTTHSLPTPLQQWFKHQLSQFMFNGDAPCLCSVLHIERDGQQLIIRFIPNPMRGHYLLLLEEQQSASFSITTLELLGLTQREAEVLFWIANDKSNVTIAKILGCCEGTVRKHLEHVYVKLGVRTRTGALMVALERLGLLQR
jgi:DNA-binding CsgD family transcriptional regulator